MGRVGSGRDLVHSVCRFCYGRGRATLRCGHVYIRLGLGIVRAGSVLGWVRFSRRVSIESLSIGAVSRGLVILRDGPDQVFVVLVSLGSL